MLVLAMLLLASLSAPSKADSAIDLEFPSRIETGSDSVYWVNLINEGDADIIVLEVVADVQGADWMFHFGSDVVRLFNGSRTVPSGGNTSFEKEQSAWGVTGALEVVVSVRFMEVGGTEELVIDRTFPVTFYVEYDEPPFEDQKEPNLLAIFSILFILFWGATMLGFFMRQAIYDFEIKKTLELDVIDGGQWFKWFDQIWWARGHKVAVLVFYGAFSLVMALMLTFGLQW